jgi:hypothetical protein
MWADPEGDWCMNTRVVPVAMAAGVLLLAGALCHSVSRSDHSHGTSGARILGGFNACGTHDLTDRELDDVDRLTSRIRQLRGITSRQIATAAAAPLGTIRVQFHVIFYTQGTQEIGRLTLSQVQSQIDRLSAAYENLDFVLENVDFTNNQQWYFMSPGSSAEVACKNALVVDSDQFLNIYSVDGVSRGYLGWATFPWNQGIQPNLDGVVIARTSIPGGTSPYNQGDTAVHEVGHWCGLYHTFQGKCAQPGDRVADTPAERTPTSGCPSSKNSCPQAGNDPIHNYMDYSSDACMTMFTPGQYTRMTEQLLTYRGDALSP